MGKSHFSFEKENLICMEKRKLQAMSELGKAKFWSQFGRDLDSPE